ncbi:MAG: SGNH/GDSL hydrolase family protein [Thermodesulfobacteriota bacterium]
MPPETPEIPYILKPNLHNATAPSNTKINTDEMGLRYQGANTRYEAKSHNEYRIVFLGDSFTFGQGVDNDKVFSHIISEYLNKWQSDYKVKIFNFGVSGYNVKTMVDTFYYRALRVKPDLVIMCIIYDDFDINRTGVVDSYGYTVNKYGSEHSKFWSFTKRLLRNVHLVYILRDIFRPSPGPESETVEGIPQTYQYLQQFKDIAEAQGISYLIVTLPSKHPRDAHILEIQEQLQKDNIRYYDLFSLADSISLRDFSLNKRDAHPSSLVHKRIADLLGRYILDNYLKN